MSTKGFTKKRILILCGGQSPEHSISIQSTANIIAAIDTTAYEITLIGISTSGHWRFLSPNVLDKVVAPKAGQEVTIIPGSGDCLFVNGKSLGAFDAAFPVLHGPNGEDGTIQGLLKLLNIPYIGPAVLSSALSMDKDMAKRVLRDQGLKVADWLLLRKGEKIPKYSEVKQRLGDILFVKPANMGSSVGVHRVASRSDWDQSISDAFQYDYRVLIEKEINGRELECAVLGSQQPIASGLGEVVSGNFYSFEEKYDQASQARTIIPADVSLAQLADLKKLALSAYRALNCEGMSRVDMFLTEAGEIYINEVNTIPGFTNISMYPKLWEHEGLSYSELISKLITLAIERG